MSGQVTKLVRMMVGAAGYSEWRLWLSDVDALGWDRERMAMFKDGLWLIEQAIEGRISGEGDCGYVREARYPVGERLIHRVGSVWEVVEDIGGDNGDYRIRCVRGTKPKHPDRKVGWEEGRELVAHGEKLHRTDGSWRVFDLPLSADEGSTE